MSKSCCSAVVLAVICLSVILLSLEADAQPTVDEITTCGSSTLEEVMNMVKVIASNQKETAKEIKEIKKQMKEEINGVKTLVASGSRDSNETTLEEVMNMVKVIALNQQENAKEIRDLKRLLISGSGETNETSLEDVVKEIKDEVKDEIRDVKNIIASGCNETNETSLENFVKDIKDEVTDEIRDVKNIIASGCGETNETSLEEVVKEIKDDVKEVKRLLTSNQTDCENVTPQSNDVTMQATSPLDNVTVQPSKEAFVSALVTNCVPLLIQQNIDGSNFFNRSWAEFKVGFGDASGNYWLGNELLSELTANYRYKLKFVLQSRSNTSNWYYAEYSTFRVWTEAYNYLLQVYGYSGNAGRDAFGDENHNGMAFSTYDRDNDRWPSGSCALQEGGGFWYKWCAYCSVNGARSTGHFYWRDLPGGDELQSSRMWLQCK